MINQRHYTHGSEDAKKLKEACEKMRKECPDIPCVVGGKEVNLKLDMELYTTFALSDFHILI